MGLVRSCALCGWAIAEFQMPTSQSTTIDWILDINIFTRVPRDAAQQKAMMPLRLG